jgi:hypothetical protein
MEELCVLGEVRTIYLCGLKYLKKITVVARSKAWVCGRSISGILGSNPTGRMIYISCELCVVSYRYLRWADHSSRGVLPSECGVSVYRIVKPR